MKLNNLLVIAGSIASINGLTIPNPFNGQQPLVLDHSGWGESVSHSIKFGKDNFFETIGKFFNEPLDSLSHETKELWSEMMTKYPGALSSITSKTTPKESTPRKDFDYHVSDSKYDNHKLRIKNTPKGLGVDDVKQYSGYLDIEDEDKHFFYWFFESRNDPKNDPVILWLNGGPGCSSLTGLFFELGPASIDKNLKPVKNPYSWNNNASVIFLDQPVNVGYSYSSESISNTKAAGIDVLAFLDLFFKQFPEYSKLPFHIAGESYGGHYIPMFAKEIIEAKDKNFELSSVLIGNGLTDVLVQYEYYQPMACGEGGYEAVVDEDSCDAMADSIPRCTSLINSCYESGSVWSCVPATIYCNNAQMGPYQKTGRNVYDIRTMCEGSSLCYSELSYIDDYLNLPEVKAAVGAEVDDYEGCNFDVNRNFMFTGDWMKADFRDAIIDVLETDLPVLIYAGDKDFICNWLGNEAWTNKLEWKGSKGFSKAPVNKWLNGKSHAGNSKNYENFTFLRVFDGGHMVPHDQPDNSLDMVNRWVSGDYSFAA